MINLLHMFLRGELEIIQQELLITLYKLITTMPWHMFISFIETFHNPHVFYWILSQLSANFTGVRWHLRWKWSWGELNKFSRLNRWWLSSINLHNSHTMNTGPILGGDDYFVPMGRASKNFRNFQSNLNSEAMPWDMFTVPKRKTAMPWHMSFRVILKFCMPSTRYFPSFLLNF